jgi:hypothetical protein
MNIATRSVAVNTTSVLTTGGTSLGHEVSFEAWAAGAGAHENVVFSTALNARKIAARPTLLTMCVAEKRRDIRGTLIPIRTWLMLVAIVVAATGRAEFPGCPAHFKAQDANVTDGQLADTSSGMRRSIISPVTGATDRSPRGSGP